MGDRRTHRARPSLTTGDAIAYSAFLHAPSPRGLWVGPVRPRSSPDRRPFNDTLSARSVAHALSIVGAPFRWLLVAKNIEADHPPLAEKLQRAGPHWMHTHALGRGA